jgi:hypothetical protein
MDKKKYFSFIIIIIIIISIILKWSSYISDAPKKSDNFNIKNKLLTTSIINLTDKQKIEISRYFIVKELSLFESNKDISDNLAKKMFTSSYYEIGKIILQKNLKGSRYTNLRFKFNNEKITSSSDKKFVYSGSVIIQGFPKNEREQTSMYLDYYLDITNENGTIKVDKIIKNIVK